MSKTRYLASVATFAIPAVFAEGDEPVIVVETANGPVRISASQYDEKQHTIFKGDDKYNADGTRKPDGGDAPQPLPQSQASASRKGKAAAQPPSPDALQTTPPAKPPAARKLGVLPQKGRFYIADANNGGKIVTDDPRIDANGYASNQDAWDVIGKLEADKSAS